MGYKARLRQSASLLLAPIVLVSGAVGAATGTPGTTIEPMAVKAPPPPWPQNPTAPAGAPNVLLIMTDDVGFGTSSTFGGPVPTPAFDALARSGLRYNQFNTTALCSPTRAALLTGRNPHNVEMGNVANLPTAYDGYTTVIPKSAGTVAEILKQNGYNTAGFGKWHLTPEWEESVAGPFDRWPTGMGFEYFYGFLSGDANQWAPRLIENTRQHAVDEGTDYFFERDMTDRAVRWVQAQNDVAPDKPFFLYFATGTAHAPHHAPRAWIDRFKGQFDQGWDAMREYTFARQKDLGVIPAEAVLTPRPPSLPAWTSLSADEKRLAAKLMEAYAGSLAYADHQIGRLMDSLRETGQLDNTLVIYIQGDNGGSAEGGLGGELYEQTFVNGYEDSLAYKLSHLDDIGGPKAFNHIPAGWGWALNTPFQYYKQAASHFGGIRNGMVMSWPARIKRSGEVRSQFHFVADIAPTILEVAGITPPATLNGVSQKPLDGISMAYSFDQPDARSRRTMQVFEMVQNLGIYQDGWWAGTRPAKAPWDILKAAKIDNDHRVWELYNISVDYSQAHDLAASQPAKLAEMQRLFWAEAERNHILPLHDPSEGAGGRPSLATGRKHFVFHPGESIPGNSAPPTIGRSYQITADMIIPSTPAQGVIATHGGRFGGYALYLKDGHPVFHYNAIGERQYEIRAPEPMTPGEHSVSASFRSDEEKPRSGGILTLSVNGEAVASGRIDKTLRDYWHTEGLDIGEDRMTPVTDDYSVAASRFSGTLKRVTFKVE